MFQALVVGTIILLSRRVVDPVAPDPGRPFDALGAVLSAVGMFFLVLGILQAGVHNTLLVIFLAPAFTVGAISSERERQTFDLLMTTLLKPRAILAAAFARARGFLCCGRTRTC